MRLMTSLDISILHATLLERGLLYKCIITDEYVPNVGHLKNMKDPTPDAIWHTAEVIVGLWAGAWLNRWNDIRKEKIADKKGVTTETITLAGQQLTSDTEMQKSLLTSMQARIASQESRMDRVQEAQDRLQITLDTERNERVRWQGIAQLNEIHIQVLQASEAELKIKVTAQSEKIILMQTRITELEVRNEMLLNEVSSRRPIGSDELALLRASDRASGSGKELPLHGTNSI